MALATHLRRTATSHRRRVMQRLIGQLLDMDGGRDDEGDDGHRAGKKPEHEIWLTSASSPRALVQMAPSGRAVHVQWNDPSDLSINEETNRSRGKEVICT